MTARTLVLLRHAKSGYPAGVEDHDRPLAPRGEREAPIAGRLLAQALASPEVSPVETAAGPDLVLVSSARRAQETWVLASPAVGEVERVETLPGLYLADAGDLLEIILDLPADVATVLIVGHNDGLEVLAATLSGADVRLKTSTFAVLGGDVPWSAWSEASADLLDVVVAR